MSNVECFNDCNKIAHTPQIIDIEIDFYKFNWVIKQILKSNIKLHTYIHAIGM